MVKTGMSFLIQIFITVITFFIFSMNLSGSETLYKFSCFYGVTLFCYIYYNSYKKYKNVFEPYMLFLIGIFLFHFGQSALYIFGYVSEKTNLVFTYNIRYSIQDAYKSNMYFLSIMLAIHLGAMISWQHENKNKPKEFIKFSSDKSIQNTTLRASRYVGVFLLLVSSWTFFSEAVGRIISSIQLGYGSLFDNSANSSIDNIFSFLKSFFWPGFYLLLLSFKNNNIIRKISTIFVIAICIGYLASSQRSLVIGTACTFIWFWNSAIKEFKRKTYTLIIAIFLVLIALFPAVKAIGSIENRDFSTLIISYIEISKNENMIFSTIDTMGWSALPLYQTMLIVPDYFDYALGKTYIYSILGVLPSIVYGGIRYTSLANLGNWLRSIMGINFGPGFSLSAELYYNFGNFGIVIAPFIGLLYHSILEGYRKEADYSLKAVKIALTVSLAENVFYSIRNSSVLIVRQYVYCYIVPFILVIFIKNLMAKGKIQRG
jgi:hypothetical protein